MRSASTRCGSALLDISFLQPLWNLLDGLRVNIVRPGLTADPRAVLGALGIAAVWQMSGFVMALYLAGLRGVSDELREAGRVDGASEMKIYRHIVIPQLRPITVTAIVLLGYTSLKMFDLVFVLTKGGPALSSDLPSIFMWETTFTEPPDRAWRRGRGADAGGRGGADPAVRPRRAAENRAMTSATVEPGRARRTTRRSRRRLRPSRIALYAVLIVLAALYLLPVYVVIVGSLKSGTEIGTSSIWALPTDPTLAPWQSALTPPLIELRRHRDRARRTAS